MVASGTHSSPDHGDTAASCAGTKCQDRCQSIMVVDRNCFTRLGLRVAFRRQVVAEAGSAGEAATLFALHQPEIVILDPSLPDRDGLDLAREFISTHARSRVLIFSHQSSEEDMYRAYSARMHGFVPKSSSREDLLRAVRLLEAGLPCFPQGCQGKIRDRSCHSGLSSREIAVLQLVARGQSNKEIAYLLGISNATAKTFLTRAMKKLGARDRTQAALAAIERGVIGRH